DSAALAADVGRLEPAVGAELARECVLGGGEEHSLLATFPADSVVPEGFRVIGAVRAGAGVSVDGIPQQPRGWDHFGG
ncbi:MAG TPA: thiamine-phosphate kinase, partial [Lapillicoccus sp.]